MSLGTSAYKYFRELPNWAQGVTVVGTMAVGYFTARAAFAAVHRAQAAHRAAITVRQTDDEIKVLNKRGLRGSYAASEYSAWADRMQKQFDGCDGIGGAFMSASGKVVKDILSKLKNDMDFLLLVSAWGKTRTYDQCGPKWMGFGDFSGNMYMAISDELDAYEIDDMNKILTKAGITYRF